MMQDREFHSSAEGEFNRPSREEFRLPREFSAMPDPDRPQSGETLPPKKRSLLRSRALMQVSAMLMSVVVVSNGFGIDLLGGGKDGPEGDYAAYYALEQPDVRLPSPHLPPKNDDSRCVALAERQGRSTVPTILVVDAAAWRGKGLESVKIPGYASFVRPRVTKYLEDEDDGSNGNEFFLSLEENRDPERKVLTLYAYDKDEFPGLSYDPASNTLTLTDYQHPRMYMDIQNMGHDFKLRLVGFNEIGSIQVYGGSLSFAGDGVLETKRIFMDADGSDACVMIGEPVTLRFIGGDASLKNEFDTREWEWNLETPIKKPYNSVDNNIVSFIHVIHTQAERGISYTDAVRLEHAVRAEWIPEMPFGEGRHFQMTALEHLSAEELDSWVGSRTLTNGYSYYPFEFSPSGKSNTRR